MKPAVAVVDWYGPYTLEEARTATPDFGDGIYMATGACKYQRAVRPQYLGITSSLSSRLNGDHHKLSLVTREQELWLGEIASYRRPGRKTKATDRMLDLAEWAHIYFLQLPLNEKKRAQPPDYPITVYNRWWRNDYATPHRRRPHQRWPDLIDFVDCDYPAKVVWFGRRQVIRPVLDFKNSHVV